MVKNYLILKTITLKNNTFDVVESMKYLWNILQFNLDDSLDVSQKLNTFYKSFYLVFRFFCKLNMETFLYLFNAYYILNCGLELW